MQEILQYSKDLNVLYIEDHKETNKQTSMLLKKLFNNVYSATNYNKAKEYFEINRDIDILITDISLPEKNGIEIAKEFKVVKPSLKVIFASAYNDTEFLLKAIELGADGFLFKPFTLDNFLKLLKNIIKLIKMEKENKEFKRKLIQLVEEKNKELLKYHLTEVGNFAKLNLDIQNKECFTCLIDINRFKIINSTFGFEFGNELLKKTAETLKNISKNLYRIGSDQFVILLDNEKEFENIRKKLSDIKITFNSFPVYLTYTIVGFYAKNIEIINNAIKAIDYIKENKLYDTVLFLDEEKLHKLSQKNQKIIFILNLIKEGKIEPFFQPIVEIQSGKIIKYEVLARIIDGDKIYKPLEFIYDIKDAGLINTITKQIIEKSIHYAQKNINLSVNITEIDLNNKNFANWIKTQIQQKGISPQMITFEIFENVSAFKNTNIKNIQSLKKEGFKIAIDNFGTGFSNFERLLDISPDYIKIDGKFIKNLHTDANARKVVMSINTIAHAIGAKVIAEFVENEEIAKILKKMGIEYAQGYYYSPPKKDIS